MHVILSSLYKVKYTIVQEENKQIKLSNLNALWGEISIGAKTKVLKNLFLGIEVQLKTTFTQKNKDGITRNIIIPEGIIFQTGKAYKELRKQLIENGLVGVISLPAGVFNPYAGVKTSILILDKKGEVLKSYSLPVGAHISVKEGDKSSLGQILVRFLVLLVSLVILLVVFHV